MWKGKLCTVCYCLVLFCSSLPCSGAGYSGIRSRQRQGRTHGRHPVYFDTINEENEIMSGPSYKNYKDAEEDYNYYDGLEVPASHHHAVKSRSSVQQHQPQNHYREEDEFLEIMRQNAASGDKWAPKERGDNVKVTSSDTHKMGEFMESFYLKFLRIEMQKSTILHSFAPDELPEVLLVERDNMSKEDSFSSENTLLTSQEESDKEMIDFWRNVGTSMEQMGMDPSEKNDLKAAEPSPLEEPADDGWLNYFRPIYRLIKDQMKKFAQELNEHKRKLERLRKQNQEEEHARDMEEGEEPFDTTDFEHETEQREIIFLDEVDCDHVFKGYYPSSPPSLKEYLDFCLQIDRNKFKHMVDANETEISTNSVSHLPQLQIQKAELWFYKASPDAMDSHKQMFSLSSIDNWDVDGKYKMFQTISLKQSPTAIGWITADISAPLVEWLSPMAFATLRSNRRSTASHNKKRHLDAYYTWKKNFGLSSKPKFFLNVSCKTCLGNTSTENVEQKQTESGNYRPFFLIDFKRIDRTKDPKRQRTHSGELRNRRDRRNLNCNEFMRDCCRERLWIEFKDNGMDFIIDPKGYYANFCRGDCNTAADQALRSAHNALINTYLKARPGMARRLGIKSCCSATQYTSLNVTYLNKNNSISERTISNLIVDSCGCN